jgi:hypothetical protein
MKRNQLLYLLLFGSSLALAGCSLLIKDKPGTAESCDTKGGTDICALPGAKTGAIENPVNMQDLTAVRAEVLKALKNKDATLLAQFVSDQGVRFSPYQNINIGMDKVAQQADLQTLRDFTGTINRGTYDGSGAPLTLSFQDYRNKFIYDADFASAPVQLDNQNISRGNIIQNIDQVYS